MQFKTDPSQTDFDRENLTEWCAALKTLFGKKIPEQASWKCLHEILQILNIIMGEASGSCRVFCPHAGGFDLWEAAESWEPGCIDLESRRETIHRIKPAKLDFISLVDDLQWSYFMLTSEELEPAGSWEEECPVPEMLVEVRQYGYVDLASCDDPSHLDEEEFLMVSTKLGRRVDRYLRGRFAIFAKGSIYCRDMDTEDARHESLSADEFRQYIFESAIRGEVISDWSKFYRNDSAQNQLHAELKSV